MKRTIISAAVVALVAGGAGVAAAGPYPNGSNDYGLCRAYQAQDDNRGGPHDKGPNRVFTEMAEEYDAANGDGAWSELCAGLLGSGNGNSQNPKGNGAKSGD
jgi:hypothetical protein